MSAPSGERRHVDVTIFLGMRSALPFQQRSPDGRSARTEVRALRGGTRVRAQKVKRATLPRRSLAIFDSSSTACRVCPSAWVVEDAAVDTPVMFCAISPDPPAASCTDRDISLVVAV